MNKVFLRLLLLPALLLCTHAAFAGILQGKVTDSKGEALPFATVFVQGTTVGTSANADGFFQLQLDAGTHNVSSQYIGYKQVTASITITGNETQTHNFSLPAEGLAIKGVTIKGNAEDPAYAIIRQAIKRRGFHLKQVRSFQAGIYLKGVMRLRQSPKKLFGQKVDDDNSMGLDSNGKGMLYLCEEVADYYAQEPNKQRTIIHSVRESGNPGGLGLSQIPPVITFYENNIYIGPQITPRGIVSPIADGALNYYKYHLDGYFEQDGRTIDKIRVTPKRAYEPLFNGYIYIAEEDWAIQSLSLSTNKKQGLELADTLRLDQTFLPLKPDTWVVQSQLFYPAIKLFGFDVTGSFVTAYNNQKVNEPVPDSVFNQHVISSYDKTANKKDTAYWTTTRSIPLEQDESRDYVRKDSILKLNTNPAHRDSLRRSHNRITVGNIAFSGVSLEAKGDVHITSNSLLTMTNYNTVEGLNMAPRINIRKTLDTGKTLLFRSAFRYGFSNHHFNGIGSIIYTQTDPTWHGRSWSVSADGGKYVFQYNPINPVQPLLNTITTLFANDNYLKLYERWDGTVRAHRNWGNGLKAGLSLSYQHRLPLENTTTYSWAKSDAGPLTSNIPAELTGYHFEEHDAVVAKASISYRPGTTYTEYPDYKVAHEGRWPLFTLNYDKGIPSILNSKTNFDKWRFAMDGRFRLHLLGSVNYNIAAGGFLNRNYVGLPDLMHIDGNQFPLASPYLQSFQMAPYYRYSNADKIYAEAHIEYNLEGLLTNKLPLFRQARWYFILGNNTYFAGNNKYYTEAFLSIDNLGYKIFRFLRVDLVESWDTQGHRNSGIRLGIHGSIFKVALNDQSQSEW